MGDFRSRFRLVVSVTLAVTLFAVTLGAFTNLRTDEVQNGQRYNEPAYNDLAGNLVYLQTPLNVHINPNSHVS
jgi:hypothetical protein